MAAVINQWSNTWRVNTDLSTYQARFIVVDTNGFAQLASDNQYIEGVLENAPTPVGMPASVCTIGYSKVQVDAAYPIGTYLVSTANGIGTQATQATAPYIRAKVLEASNEAGDIVMVRLIDEVGVQGIQGLTGLQGPQGPTGLNGITGIIGSQGPVGNQGITGLGGKQGITGLGGNQGITGLGGLQGITGIATTGNTTTWTGLGDPSVFITVNGYWVPGYTPK